MVGWCSMGTFNDPWLYTCYIGFSWLPQLFVLGRNTKNPDFILLCFCHKRQFDRWKNGWSILQTLSCFELLFGTLKLWDVPSAAIKLVCPLWSIRFTFFHTQTPSHVLFYSWSWSSHLNSFSVREFVNGLVSGNIDRNFPWQHGGIDPHRSSHFLSSNIHIRFTRSFRLLKKMVKATGFWQNSHFEKYLMNPYES